jgi:transcriptional regulator with XRE-family HTH domain
MPTSSNKLKQLAQRLHSKEYRDALVEAEIANGIAFQIRAMQAERGWTQKQLGDSAGMEQGSISRLLNSSGNSSLTTLRRMASAFDVALITRFVPFSQLLEWTANLSRDRLAPASFHEELKAAITSVESIALPQEDSNETAVLPRKTLVAQDTLWATTVVDEPSPVAAKAAETTKERQPEYAYPTA